MGAKKRGKKMTAKEMKKISGGVAKRSARTGRPPSPPPPTPK
jgi:bacteriocin-like protein